MDKGIAKLEETVWLVWLFYVGMLELWHLEP